MYFETETTVMITKKAEYGIIILTELARAVKGKRIPARKIVRKRHVPDNLILPLIGVLREAGWVQTTRGPAGGVALIRDPDGITLREVIELFDGPMGITRCLLRDLPCRDQTSCPLRRIWFRAQNKMLEVLEETTIASLSKACDD